MIDLTNFLIELDQAAVSVTADTRVHMKDPKNPKCVQQRLKGQY